SEESKIAVVAEIQAIVRTQREPARARVGGGGKATVARLESTAASAGHRCDGPAGSNFAHSIVPEVAEEDISRRIHHQAERRVDSRGSGRAAVAGKARDTGPREGGDDPVRCDLADTVSSIFGDVNGAVRADDHGTRLVHFRGGGQSPVACVSG